MEMVFQRPDLANPGVDEVVLHICQVYALPRCTERRTSMDRTRVKEWIMVFSRMFTLASGEIEREWSEGGRIDRKRKKNKGGKDKGRASRNTSDIHGPHCFRVGN